MAMNLLGRWGKIWKLIGKPRRNVSFTLCSGLRAQSVTPGSIQGAEWAALCNLIKLSWEVSWSICKVQMTDSRWCFHGISVALPCFLWSKGTQKDALLLPLVPLISKSVTGEQLCFLIWRDRGELCIHMLEDN